MSLSARQREALVFICDYIAAHGYPPGLVEIAASMGIGHPRAHQHLVRLEKYGYIARVPRTARSIRVLRLASGMHVADAQGGHPPAKAQARKSNTRRKETA